MASHSLRAALACLLLGCQRVPIEDQPPVEEESETAMMMEDEGGPVDDDGGIAPEFGCEPGDEASCPTGEKCTAISEGGPQNHFECVPDDGMLLPGDDCTPAQGTGQDGCTSGHVCLMSQEGDTLGRCLEACRNDDDCDEGQCTESPFTLTTFCADDCDPLVPACDPGLACRQSDDRFVCGMNLDETDIGQFGEPCDSFNLRGCAENYACMPGALIPGCVSGSCCTTVCDLGGGDEQCAAPTLCRPLFAEPAPGFETIGACFVPA